MQTIHRSFYSNIALLYSQWSKPPENLDLFRQSSHFLVIVFQCVSTKQWVLGAFVTPGYIESIIPPPPTFFFIFIFLFKDFTHNLAWLNGFF